MIGGDVAAGEGRLAVVWIDDRDGGPEVYLAVLDADGAKRLADTRVSDGSGTAADPDVDADGRILVSWARPGAIEVVAVDESGAQLDAATISQSGDIIRPSMAVTPNGFLQLAWERYTVSMWRVYYALLEPDLSGQVTLINDADIIGGSSPKEPQVSVDQAGSAYLWWRDMAGVSAGGCSSPS